MSHGSNCKCMFCSLGKALGMIKKSDQGSDQSCSCGSGKNYKDCCGSESK